MTEYDDFYPLSSAHSTAPNAHLDIDEQLKMMTTASTESATNPLYKLDDPSSIWSPSNPSNQNTIHATNSADQFSLVNSLQKHLNGANFLFDASSPVAGYDFGISCLDTNSNSSSNSYGLGGNVMSDSDSNVTNSSVSQPLSFASVAIGGVGGVLPSHSNTNTNPSSASSSSASSHNDNMVLNSIFQQHEHLLLNNTLLNNHHLSHHQYGVFGAQPTAANPHFQQFNSYFFNGGVNNSTNGCNGNLDAQI
jgi:hypothetical protein